MNCDEGGGWELEGADSGLSAVDPSSTSLAQ